VLYGGYQKPVGEHWYREIAPDQCRLREFRLQICVRAVNTVQTREMPQGKLGVIRKVARHGRQSGLKPRNRKYFLNCGGCICICHETSAWITPSAVTWTCWIVGIHVDVAHAQESFQLGLRSWTLGMLQSIHVLVVHVQLPGADNVSEVLDFVGEPYALFQCQGHPGFAQTMQNGVNVFDVLFRVCGEDDDIV